LRVSGAVWRRTSFSLWHGLGRRLFSGWCNAARIAHAQMADAQRAIAGQAKAKKLVNSAVLHILGVKKGHFRVYTYILFFALCHYALLVSVTHRKSSLLRSTCRLNRFSVFFCKILKWKISFCTFGGSQLLVLKGVLFVN